MAGADAQGATMKSPLPFWPALLACLTMPAIAASFDCGQARTPVERAICTDPSLSAQDEQLALLFEQAKLHGERSEVIRQQKGWLKTRDACKDLTCLRKHYKSQVQLLQPVADLANGQLIITIDDISPGPWHALANGIGNRRQQTQLQLIVQFQAGKVFAGIAPMFEPGFLPVNHLGWLAVLLGAFKQHGQLLLAQA
jgi:uncharacterized protein